MKKQYIAPFILSKGQQQKQLNRIRFAQNMLVLRGIHHEISEKKTQMLEREALINSIAS